MNQHAIDDEKIAAFVFYNTAINTGLKNGIVVRLEREFGKCVLQLACKHYIFELVAGADVYGATTGPTQEAFKKLTTNWSAVDKSSWSPIALPSSIRFLASLVEETIAFLRQWISTNVEHHLRHDYQ